MSSLSTIPKDFASAKVVQVLVEASDNAGAIRSIWDWAAANGFVRAPENALRVTYKNKTKVYSGICYRWEPEDQAAADEDNRSLRNLIQRMPKTQSSAEILREERQ